MYGPRISAYIFTAGLSPSARRGPWVAAELIAAHIGAISAMISSGIVGNESSKQKKKGKLLSSSAAFPEELHTLCQVMQRFDGANMLVQHATQHVLKLAGPRAQKSIKIGDCFLIRL